MIVFERRTDRSRDGCFFFAENSKEKIHLLKFRSERSKSSQSFKQKEMSLPFLEESLRIFHRNNPHLSLQNTWV